MHTPKTGSDPPLVHLEDHHEKHRDEAHTKVEELKARFHREKKPATVFH